MQGPACRAKVQVRAGCLGDGATVPAARPAPADQVFRAKHSSCLLQLPKQPWGCCVKPRCLFKPRRLFRVLSVCQTRFPG